MSVKMEGVGNEVSEKIRAAIKAKLIELGAYVDDELPDYIMVMVANKRSRTQMEDDLALFLNNNTKVFTAWLHNVLKKLQEVTVAAGEKVEEPKKTKKKIASQNEVKSPNGYKKSKKKHSKKHREKKPKKLKRKLKESDNKGAGELSDWESPENVKKKVKEEKMETVDVRKEVGKAIIGNLKTKHKIENVVKEPKEVDLPVMDTQEPITTTDRAEVPIEPEEHVQENDGSNLDQEQNGSDGISIIEVKSTPNDASTQNVPFVMAPTKELLKKHDKLTQKVESGDKLAENAPSEFSESPEELRRELLLSRAKKKLAERDLESRMRSNSPEVVIVAEKTKDSIILKDAEPMKKQVTPPVESPKLSLDAHSSLVDYFSGDDSSSSRRPKSKRSKKVVVESRIVAIPEPEEPGISSIVLVKPRQFAPHEKQANKNLILKAVAAAERSVAQAPVRKTQEEPTPKKSGKRPKAIFTRDLREKRYEMINVTLPNVHETDSSVKKSNAKQRQVEDKWESEEKSSKKSGEEENFISSKTMGKDRNESFIKCWLDEVEEAGKHNALIKPDEIDAAAIIEQNTEEVDDVSMHDDMDALQDGPQIVVTVDGSRFQNNLKPKNRITSKVDLNRISNRFSRISKPAEDHEFKEKYKEFERVRTEKKVSKEGESKNKRLIAELSIKFGKVNRVFDNDVKDVRERLGDVKRNELSRKREARKSSDTETPREKRDKTSVRVSAEYDDVRMKSKERCRFWPDCGRASSCDYHHPTSTCKLLPNCKHGDKCLYIHPLCKNNRDCKLKDCAYDHQSPRKRPRENSRDSRKGQCKYDSYCKIQDCQYQHKRTCKFGSRCRKSDCIFSHPR